jgi:FkbM family methyltransferase
MSLDWRLARACMFQTLSFILNHPLNQGHKAAALARYLRWQTSSRITSGKISMPFVNKTRLLVRHGMKGATGNIYCGLHEFNDMAFVVHTLRPEDLFVDAGANIGSYTILAAGVAGARTVSVEPAPSTFRDLEDNVRHNDLSPLVQAKNVALGETSGTLHFTSGLDTVNHVVATDESNTDTVSVSVLPLDELLAGEVPTVMKIDVEGFESAVIRGATKTLASPLLLGILMELNGSGTRYGYDEKTLHQQMLKLGFSNAAYDPFTRRISLQSNAGDNSLYVRDIPALQSRLQSAPRTTINGVSF